MTTIVVAILFESYKVYLLFRTCWPIGLTLPHTIIRCDLSLYIFRLLRSTTIRIRGYSVFKLPADNQIFLKGYWAQFTTNWSNSLE